MGYNGPKDTIEGARIFHLHSVLIKVKLHALYIMQNTLMAKWYQGGSVYPNWCGRIC